MAGRLRKNVSRVVQDDSLSQTSEMASGQVTQLLSEIVNRLDSLERGSSASNASRTSNRQTDRQELETFEQSVEKRQSCIVKMTQKLPTFDGRSSENPMIFLRDLKAYIKVSGDSSRALIWAADSLVGIAKVRMSIYRDSWRTYSDFEKDFREVFWGDNEQELIKQRFLTAKFDSKKGQSMEEFFASQLNSIYELTIPFTDTEKINTIFRQLPRDIQVVFFARKEPMTIRDAVEFLRHLERNVDGGLSAFQSSETMNTNNITGAGHGIGRELALQLAELGATVVCWDNDARHNNAVVDEIRNKDGESFGYTVDVTAREQVWALAAHMRRQLTDVSMVISNAGVLTCAPIAHLRPEAAANIIEVNLMAHFWVIQAFLPSMIERRRGHIVAINSSAGLMPCSEMVPYSAAKFGLRGLMESISEELRLDTWTRNINTTSVYLATVSTGLYPSPSHRFTSLYSEVTAKEAAGIIIEGIRKNHKSICIPKFMKFFMGLLSLLPYRIRIIFTDFFNFC